MSLKWPLWIGLYVVLGVLVPWATALSWAHQHGSEMRPRVRQLFQRGELGLVGLVVVISVIWNLLQSQFMQQTIALAAVLLAVIGTMAGDVWIESYAGSRPAQLGTPKEPGATPEIWRFSYSRWHPWLKSYWTDLRRWQRYERSSPSFGEASTPQSNRSACGCGRRCGISLPNFWPASRLFPGGVPTDHRNQLAAWLPRSGPDGTYARARRISLPARVLSAFGEADGSGGCMFGVVANHRRGRTQLSYGKRRRSDNFAGPAESASCVSTRSIRFILTWDWSPLFFCPSS